jgi:hypothetical protein
MINAFYVITIILLLDIVITQLVQPKKSYSQKF